MLFIARGRVLDALANQDFIMRNEYILVGVAYEHNVGIVFVELGEEQVAAVRGNGDAIAKIAIGFEDVTGFLG